MALEYGLSGMTLGDNELARAALACELAADLYADAHMVACPSCCSVGGSPRFIDNCRFCGGTGNVTEQRAQEWAPQS